MIARDDRDLHPHPEDRAARAAPAVVLIIAATAVMVAAIGIRGEFPLSDDWSYAYTTRVLCTEGVLRFLPWSGASLILQAGYGAALCRLFGFSFTVLRTSTVVLAAAGAAGFLLLMRACGVRGATLALAVVVFALNPLYVSLAFTFMTDVPFTVAAVWAGVWYARGLNGRRTGALVAGSVAATAALLIRQHGLLVAIAAACAALLDPAAGWRGRMRQAAAAATLPAVAFVAFHVWLFGIHGSPQGYVNKIGEAQAVTLTTLGNSAFRGLAYLGLFLAPITVGLGTTPLRRAPRVAIAAFAGVGLIGGALYVWRDTLMPYLTNVLYDLGVGALSLRDTLFLGLPPPIHVGAPLEVPLTLAALVATAMLITFAVAGAIGADDDGARAQLDHPDPRPGRARVDAATRFTILAAILLFAGTLLHVRYYFDRYLLPALPFAIAALLGSTRRTAVRPASVVLAALLAAYAIAGTHDYLAWNRARYSGLEALRADGVPVTAIDGGFEFNAWHLAATLGTWPTDAESRTGQPATLRSWWWVVDDRFVASFRPLGGYHVARELAYTRWLVPGTGRVLILERDVPTPP